MNADSDDSTPITPEVADELRALFAVARTVNGSTALDDPRRQTSLEFTTALHALLEQGVTVYRLAQVLGTSHQTIYGRLARHGYRTPPPSQADRTYRGTTVHASRRRDPAA
ncbi:helix-turn-helix domain-containing protein [Streptomyces nigra]|uniref:helix-turn-helix domain-containing protein n=1 Tax=Streptomyces nigra TaxID=1827580 RepID=UPI0037D8C77D